MGLICDCKLSTIYASVENRTRALFGLLLVKCLTHYMFCFSSLSPPHLPVMFFTRTSPLFLRLSPLDETSLWLLARFQTTQCGVFGSYRQRKTGRVQCSEHEAGAVLSLRWQRCADRSGEIRRSGGHRPQGLWPHDANYHERVPGDGREGHGMRSKVAFNFWHAIHEWTDWPPWAKPCRLSDFGSKNKTENIWEVFWKHAI